MLFPPHVVRRQVLELGVAREEDAPALQEEAGRVCRERLAPLLDRVLSRASSGDEVVRLDRLEIDLGVLAQARFADELVRRAGDELERLLGERLAALRRSGAAAPAGRLLTAAASRLEALRVFLETGSFPWWAPQAVAGGPEALLAELLEEAPARVGEILRRVAGPRVGRRVLRQLSPALRRRLLEALAAGRPEVAAALEDWPRLLAEEAPAGWPGALRDPAFVADRALFHWTSRPATELTAPALCELLLAGAAVESGMAPEALLPRLASRARRLLVPESGLRSWLAERAQGLEAPDAPQAGAPTGPGAGGELEARALGGERPPAERQARRRPLHEPGSEGPALPEAAATPRDREGRLPEETLPRPASTRTPESVSKTGTGARTAEAADAVELVRPPVATGRGPEEPAPEPPRSAALRVEDEALFVDDAGLVVLAPFLPTHFGRLGLLGKRRFVSPEARERAVLLVRYLATGKAEAGEHLLALDKILCGWPLAEPVLRAIEPSPAEEKATREILASVLEHWSALGKTSVDGLRGAFLAREGRLTENGQGWHLAVERRGIDVLLDRLPWGIGLIKLPWMDRPLFVEW